MQHTVKISLTDLLVRGIPFAQKARAERIGLSPFKRVVVGSSPTVDTDRCQRSSGGRAPKTSCSLTCSRHTKPSETRIVPGGLVYQGGAMICFHYDCIPRDQGDMVAIVAFVAIIVLVGWIMEKLYG